MTTRDGSFNRIAMSNYMDTVVKAYLAFLRTENHRDLEVTFMPKEIRIFRESSGHTYSFSIENEERTFAAVRVSITSEHSTSTSMYMPDGTQPTADIIRDHVEAMRGSDDEARRSKLREFFREVVHVYRKAALKPPWEMTNHEDVHGWGTDQTKVWIEVKYDKGGVLVSVGGFEWMLKPGYGQPTPEFARDHVNRKDLRIADVGISEHIRLAREDAEPKVESPSNALAALRGRVLHEYMSTGFFEEAGELLVTNDGVPMHVQDSAGTIRLKVREFPLCSPPFVEAIIGGTSRHYFLDRPIDRPEIHRHIRNANKYAREIIGRTTGLTNVPSWLGMKATEAPTGIAAEPTITGDPSALAGVLGKMGDRAQREAQAVFDAKAGEMRKTLVGLGLIPTGEERVEAIRFMVSMGKALEQSRAAKLPYLIVNLSEEMPDKIDAQERASGCDAREGKLAWTYRKTAELEARFSATIRNTLREWPSHQGVPMIIHTHVDQGVFVLTLKAAP